MVSLRELSYLSRREFQIKGGQVGDQSSAIRNKWMMESEMDFPKQRSATGEGHLVTETGSKSQLANEAGKDKTHPLRHRRYALATLELSL